MTTLETLSRALSQTCLLLEKKNCPLPLLFYLFTP